MCASVCVCLNLGFCVSVFVFVFGGAGCKAEFPKLYNILLHDTGTDFLFWPSWALDTHVQDTYIHVGEAFNT